MTSALAHELNQPLMAISNYARASQHLAGELAGPDTLRQALNSLVAEVGHAGSVIHRLREYYRYGGLHRETFEARPFFEASLEPLRQRARRHRIALTVATDDEVGRLHADPIQLGIVLHNLVSNAIEAIADTHAHVREIAVHVGRPDRITLRVCVDDRGPGVDPAQADELFSPQVSGKAMGMGLGLSICRTLVEGHGGRIWHEARAGGGARFCFTLPILEDELGSDGLHR
jgi:signal transduction histidine kinase